MSLIGGMTTIELKKLREDEVLTALRDFSDLKLNIAFKYLQARGCRSEALDARIEAGLRAELKNGNE